MTTDTQNTPAKSTRQMAFVILDDGTIQANFGPGLDPLQLRPSEVPEKIQLAAITEGLVSRARSSASKLEGESRTSAALREVIGKAFDALRAGEWKMERAAGGEAEYTIEVEAAWEFRKLRAASKGEEYTGTLAEVAESWAALSEDVKDSDGKVTTIGEKSKVKALPRYQQALAIVKARRAAAKAEAMAKKANSAEQEEGNF